MRSRSFFACLAICLLALSACGGVLPAPSSAEKAVSHHLERYAKKYPASAMAAKKIQKIDVYSLNQEKRGYASATAFLTTPESEVYQAQFVLKREPFGWRVSAWEILQGP